MCIGQILVHFKMIYTNTTYSSLTAATRCLSVCLPSFKLIATITKAGAPNGSFGRPVIASNFRSGKCHLEFS